MQRITPGISAAARRRVVVSSVLIAAAVALAAGPRADAKLAVKGGKYKGKTTQEAVAPAYRKIEFRVKKGKVTLLTEPVVARGLCLSTPVFTLGGETPKAKLNGKGAFSFTSTFIGSKFDRIKGKFVSEKDVEGFAIYNFQAQDLCSAGQTRVKFTASR
jgi:hypothetical protein